MENKRDKKIQINISNRGIYFLITIGIIISLSIGAYALTAGTKPNPGHTISEMGVPSGCTAGQVITWDGSSLICQTPSQGDASEKVEVIITSQTYRGNFGANYCKELLGADWNVCQRETDLINANSCLETTGIGGTTRPCVDGTVTWAVDDTNGISCSSWTSAGDCGLGNTAAGMAWDWNTADKWEYDGTDCCSEYHPIACCRII